MAPKRKKYSIASVEITPDDNASVKRVMDRLMGRGAAKPEATQSTLSAQGSYPAQPTQSSQPAQGSLTSPSDPDTASSQTAQGSSPTQSSSATQSRKTAQSGRVVHTEAAPSRDYTKTANSIVRDALRAGLFKGKSKQLYDFLYAKSRGAIIPRLSVQLRRGEIMKGAHIGSTHTLRDNLQHLRAVGLVTWTEKAGEQDGNVYSVYLPEEAHLPFDLDGNPVQLTSLGQLNCPDHPEQNLPRPPRAESAQSAQGLSQADSIGSSDPKTSFKTNTERSDDDEAGAAVARAIKELIKEVTGKEATPGECLKMTEVIEVLKLEAKIAAGRTTVSSTGPFLAEHLRRRLFKKDKQEMAVETSAIEPPTPAIDAEKCPECSGTGWYYPEGKEKGIARCRHTQLAQSDGDVEMPGRPN